LLTDRIFKNLLEIESGISCYINYIDDPDLAHQLLLIDVKRDTEITRMPSENRCPQVVFKHNDGLVTVSTEEAETILVRACEVCWACGECGPGK